MPWPLPPPTAEKPPEPVKEPTEEPADVSEEKILLAKIRQMAEDTEETGENSVPAPVPRPRKRLIPSESDFQLPPTPPLPLKVNATTRSRLSADQDELPAAGVPSEEASVGVAKLNTIPEWPGKDMLRDDRGNVQASAAKDEALESPALTAPTSQTGETAVRARPEEVDKRRRVNNDEVPTGGLEAPAAPEGL